MLSPNIRNKTRISSLSSPIQHCLEILDSAVSQEKKRAYRLEKKELKLSLFTDNLITYTENTKKPTEKLLVSLERLQHTRSTNKNQSYFYILAMNN